MEDSVIADFSQYELSFYFYGLKPVSTNDMYIPTYSKTKSGKLHSFLRKSKELSEFQDKISKSFDDEVFYSKEYISKVSKFIKDNNLGIRLSIITVVPKNEYITSKNKLYRVDSSNMIKSVEDAIYKGIGIDDTYNLIVSSYKKYSDDNNWMIIVKLCPILCYLNNKYVESECNEFYDLVNNTKINLEVINEENPNIDDI